MVSDLTFEDQKLISKIKDKFKGENKQIIVIHNLFYSKEIEEVQNKLEERIMKSFKLK